MHHKTVSDETERTAAVPERKTSPPKNPRTDGLLVVADPNSNNTLRALVSMEAKLNSFDESDEYQSRSNAIDAFGQQEVTDKPWPLLLFLSLIHISEPTRPY